MTFRLLCIAFLTLAFGFAANAAPSNIQSSLDKGAQVSMSDLGEISEGLSNELIFFSNAKGEVEEWNCGVGGGGPVICSKDGGGPCVYENGIWWCSPETTSSI